MKIIDLAEEHKELYFLCLEDWSEEAKGSGSRKKEWFERMKDKGLRVKLAIDDTGEVGGMIQYIPIEHSFVDGRDLYFIYCVWVHGYKQGRGNFQKRGMGRALIQAAEEDARSLGAKGIAAWGLWLPFWMKASWFKKQGYKKADRQGLALLVWKPFSEDAEPPKWFEKKKQPSEKIPGKVIVTSYVNGWCMAMNIIYERAKRASQEFGDKVVFKEVDTCDRECIAQCGLSDALFIDGKEISFGPPPSYEKLHAIIAKKVKKL
ncbi:MAG: hypothetical protein Kow0090_18890 [Myxococcota bacterium]